MQPARSRVLIAIALSVAIGLPGMSAETSSPIKVIRVGEVGSFHLPAKKGTASAPAGTRIVTVTVELNDAVQSLQAEDLQLTADGMLFECSALGDTEKGYCPAQSMVLIRRDQAFQGDCLMGGPVQVPDSGVAAAFVVSKTVPLEKLQLLYSFPGGSVGMDSAEPVSLPEALSARVVKLTEYPKLSGVVLDLEVRNGGSSPYPVTFDTFRLSIPAGGGTGWRVGQGHLYDRTGVAPDAPDGAGIRSRSVDLAPGKATTIRIQFLGVNEFPVTKSRLGFFRTVMVPVKPGP